MFRRITPSGLARVAGRGDAAEGRCERDEQRGEPCCRQIDEIIKPCRCPAEIRKTRRTMADHAVGRVDRLVKQDADEPADRQPESRRNDGIGKILSEAFDRGARNARLIEHGRVAADDPPDRLAPRGEPIPLQRVCDRLDMIVKRALRQLA